MIKSYYDNNQCSFCFNKLQSECAWTWNILSCRSCEFLYQVDRIWFNDFGIHLYLNNFKTHFRQEWNTNKIEFISNDKIIETIDDIIINPKFIKKFYNKHLKIKAFI